MKIAITGPEGCGKSILASALSNYFSCPLVTDYCNYFLDHHENKEISKDDLIKIASGKLNLERQAQTQRNKLVISDGELTMLKIWSEFKFTSCSEELKSLIKKQHYDLYLLISPDTISTKYEFKREDPSLRKYFFNAFKKEFDEKNVNYIIIEGEFYSRKKRAVEAIERLLLNKSSL